MNENKDFLAKEPIGHLLLKLALPTVAARSSICFTTS